MNKLTFYYYWFFELLSIPYLLARGFVLMFLYVFFKILNMEPVAEIFIVELTGVD